VAIDSPFQDVMKVHREIGEAIFGPSSPVGVPFEIKEPPVPEVVRKALGMDAGEPAKTGFTGEVVE